LTIAIKIQNVKFFFQNTSLSSQEVNPIHTMTPTEWQTGRVILLIIILHAAV